MLRQLLILSALCAVFFSTQIQAEEVLPLNKKTTPALEEVQSGAEAKQNLACGCGRTRDEEQQGRNGRLLAACFEGKCVEDPTTPVIPATIVPEENVEKLAACPGGKCPVQAPVTQPVPETIVPEEVEKLAACPGGKCPVQAPVVQPVPSTETEVDSTEAKIA